LSAVLRDAPDVRSLQPEASETLALLVSRCLEKDPELRPSAEALARELGTFAEDNGVAPLDVLERDGALQAEKSSTVLSDTLVEVRRKTPA
jgi:hypothetical protein